jgi:[acyl-carrier-protein] S-malonyltransferase
MAEASGKLGEVLDTIDLRTPTVPLVNNADAIFLNAVESIKASLVRQLNSPLLWEDSIRAIRDSGVEIFVEVGPGKVLSGLIKRIVPGVKTLNVEDLKSLDKTLSELTPSV